MEPELKEKIHSIAFRAIKAECLGLPEITDIVRHVELEPNAMKVYKHLVRDSFAELKNAEVTATNILTKILRLSQLTGGFIGDDEGHKAHKVSNAKLQALEDIVDEVTQSGKKLVITARFIPEIKAITQLPDRKKIKFSIITGSIKNRDEQIEKFKNNPEIKVFVWQIATAGLGITLTAASTTVFYSINYSMSNFEQCKAGIHRAGQK